MRMILVLIRIPYVNVVYYFILPYDDRLCIFPLPSRAKTRLPVKHMRGAMISVRIVVEVLLMVGLG